jgi:ABC-2 type transport system permease protein
MRTFWDFVKADIQITVRNRQALFWTFFFPVLLMFLLGVAFGQSGSSTTKLAIVDQDRGPVGAALVSAFQKVDALKVSTVAGESQALKSLRNGDYAAVLVLPAGLQQRLAGGATQLPFYYDNTSLSQAGTVTMVTQQVVNAFAEQASGSQPRFELRSQGIASSSFNYISFLVPGVVAMALMTKGIYGVSGSFVAYRQRGVLRRLKATPMPLPSFIGSRVLVHLFLALIQAGLVIAVGVVAFHVHMAPGPTLARMAVLALIGSGSFVSIGFFVAAISKNVESAAALGQVIGTPMMFLSGIFFPMDNAPAWIQPVVKAMPLYYLANAMRDVMIKGFALWAVRWDIMILVLVTGVFLACSVRFFRWE